MMSEQNENTNKDINYKKKPNSNSVAEQYNWNEKLTRAIQQWIWASKRISKREVRTTKMIQSRKQKEKRMKNSDQSLETPWSWPTHIMGVPEG